MSKTEMCEMCAETGHESEATHVTYKLKSNPQNGEDVRIKGSKGYVCGDCAEVTDSTITTNPIHSE